MGLGAAAFWISVAAFFIAMGWFKSRADERKQETLLRILEKTGRLDEEQMRLLFPPAPPAQPLPPNHPWVRGAQPGAHRAAMRIFGTLLLSISVGLAVLFLFMMEFGTAEQRVDLREDAAIGSGIAALIACVGIGFFAAALFFPPAVKHRDDSQAQ
jgi:hypothetical protein